MLTGEATFEQQLPAAGSDAQAVRAGLTAWPKQLPPYLLYDERGSALFEEITRVPEYYLTRTELGLLQGLGKELAERTAPLRTVLELGAGTAAKTRAVLEALSSRGALTYLPIDVSASALELARRSVQGRGIRVRPLCGRYEQWLPLALRLPGPRLALFIGSSIGNLEPAAAAALLSLIRRSLEPGDGLLLGADLPKDVSVLEAAYDDAFGVTAAFNRNLLARLNREYQGDFDLQAFRHVARWNEAASRMELYLEATRPQSVHLAALQLTVSFGRGERLHTENSYKFPLVVQRALMEHARFRLERTWLDDRFPYAVHLAQAA